MQSWQKLINCLQKRLSQVSVSSYHTKTGTIKSCANLTGGKWWLICFIFILLTRSKTDYPLFSMNWLTLCDLWLFFYWIVSWSFLTDLHDQFLHREISSFWCVLQIFFLVLLIAFKFLCGIFFDRQDLKKNPHVLFYQLHYDKTSPVFSLYTGH